MKSESRIWLFETLNSPGWNTDVSCLSLLQGIFPTQESNWGLLQLQADSLPAEEAQPRDTSLQMNVLVRSGGGERVSWVAQWGRAGEDTYCIFWVLLSSKSKGEALTKWLKVWKLVAGSYLQLSQTQISPGKLLRLRENSEQMATLQYCKCRLALIQISGSLMHEGHKIQEVCAKSENLQHHRPK